MDDEVDAFLKELDATSPHLAQQSQKQPENDEELAQMVGMGFDLEESKIALIQTENNVDQAIDYINGQQQNDPTLPVQTSQKELKENQQEVLQDLMDQKQKQTREIPSEQITKFAMNAFKSLSMAGGQVEDRLRRLTNTAGQRQADLSLPVVQMPSKEEVQAYRRRMLDQPQMTSSELYKMYIKDCINLKTEPEQIILAQLSICAKNNRRLLNLDLGRMGFDSVSMTVLCKLLSMAYGLRRLSVDYTNINDSMLQQLLNTLRLMDKLPWLCLANNFQLTFGGLKLIALYAQNSKTLRYLDVSGHRFDIATASLFSQALQGTIADVTSLRDDLQSSLEILRLDSCQLNNEVLEQLISGLNHSNLKMLSLRNNNLDSRDASCLAGMLSAANCRIEKLDFGDNTLGAHGVQILLKAIPASSSQLRQLSLANNALHSDFFEVLLEFLKCNETLTLLDLSNNMTLCRHVVSLTLLKEGLIKTKSLKVILLDRTGLTAEGAITIAESLAETKSLQHMSLLDNEAAVNPLRANVANIGQNVLSFGQKALKSVAVGFNSIRERANKNSMSAQSDDAFKPANVQTEQYSPIMVAIPTAVELAFSALLAIHASMKLNTSMVQLDLIDKNDLLAFKDRRASNPIIAQVYMMVGEIDQICAKNARVQHMKESAGLATVSRDRTQSNATVSLEVVQQNLDASKTAMKQLKQIMSEKSTTSIDGQEMSNLCTRCVQLRLKLLDCIDEDSVVREKQLSDRLMLTCAELANVIAMYESLQQSSTATVADVNAIGSAATEDQDDEYFEIGED